MKRSLFFFLCSLLLTTALTAQVTLIPYKDSWKYLDNGSDQGTAWRSPAFSDGGWKTGSGKFGYGMDGLATTLGFGPDKDHRYTTYYFRKTITVANPDSYSSFAAALNFDDGIVLYVNGNEVYRNNMPSGSVSHTTFAASSATLSKTATINKSAFVAGTNVLAVEVHQISLTSGDMAFDLRLQATPDATAPKVSGTTRQLPAANPTNASSATWRVVFTEKVKGVDVADFTVTPTSGTPGGSVASVTPVGSDGATYDVKVSGISGTGALRLDTKASGTGITDMVGNALSTGYTSGQTYTIERTAPTLLSINRQLPTATLTNATSLVFRATFSEAVTGVEAADFALTRIDGSVTGAPDAITPVGTTGTAFDVRVAVNGSGNLRLDLKSSGTGIADIATNALTGGFTTGQTIQVDHALPYVTGITRLTPLTELTKASTLVYRVVFSEKVTSVGVADFSPVAATGTVKGTIESGDLDMVGTDGTTYDVKVTSVSGSGLLRLDLKASGTGIVDAAKNACGGYTTGQVFNVDKTAPKVGSIVRFAPLVTSTNGTSVVYRAVFNEPVRGVHAADFSLTTVSGTAKGVIAADALKPVGADSTTYDINVSALTGNGQLRLNLKSSGTGITDVATNAISSGFTSGESYTLDVIAPTVVSVSRQLPDASTNNATALTYRVVFSEAVTGLKNTDFLFTTVSGTTTGLVAAGGVVAVGTAGTTWDVTVSNVTNTGTVRLDVKTSGTAIKDIATNGLAGGFSTGQTFNVDQTRPVVTGIARQAPVAETTNTSTVTWRVTFSEKVSGVDLSDFALSAVSGVRTGAPGTVTAVGTSGTTYDVTATGISSHSTVRLDVAATALLQDVVGNALSGGYALGQTYTIDPPATVLSINRQLPSTEQTNASSVTWRVAFSERVNNVDPADFTLTNLGGSSSGALAAGSVMMVGGTGSLYEVTVTNISTTEVIRLDLKSSGTGITDSYGSGISDGPSPSGGLTFSGFKAGQSYTIDKTLPAITGISWQQPATNLTNGTSVTWRVTFSEKVSGVDPADFNLTTLTGTTTGMLAAGAVVPVGTEGTTYEVTATSISGTGSLRLDLRNGGTGITDMVTNAIGTGYTTGQSYQFDYTAPSLLTFNRYKPTVES
ncbi:hypothetical protein V9K67_23415, partial [Paraflavisolibacter sp. H34]|uniref:beta strand repeat-containing protein n=1 Tax=Huijunlia imazamoxiresistens TaxID=3127457 RepID=UPI00301F59BF